MVIRSTRLLAIGAIVTALAPAGLAQGKSQAELRKPFIGTWRLVSIEGGPQNAANRGAKPTGIIMYDQHGLMNAQIMPDRPRPKWTGAPTPEQALESDPRLHRVLGHLHDRREGADGDAPPPGDDRRRRGGFVRKYELKDGGNRITLTPVSGGTTNPPNHLTWERVR